MTWLCDNIIGIVSLIVSIFIAIFVPITQHNIAKNKAAREFLLNNANEKKYLLLVQLAAFLNPQEHHCRAIYNNFNSCPKWLPKINL